MLAKLQTLRFAPRMIRSFLVASLKISREFLAPLLVVNALACLILASVHFLAILPVLEITYDREFQNILLTFFTVPVTAFIVSGLLQFYQKLLRKEEADLSVLFGGNRGYLRVLLLCLLYYSAYVILFKVAFRDIEEDWIFRIRVFLGLLLFAWLLVRLMFAPLFAVEEGTGLKDSVKGSFFLTSTHTTHSLVLTVFFVLFVLVGLLPLFVALQFDLPGFWVLLLIATLVPGSLWIICTMSITIISYVLLYDYYRGKAYAKKKGLFIPEIDQDDVATPRKGRPGTARS